MESIIHIFPATTQPLPNKFSSPRRTNSPVATTPATEKMTMMIRVRSRDGLERVPVAGGPATTVGELAALIETHLNVPVASQTLSTDRDLLLARTPDDLSRRAADPAATLAALGLSHGSIVYLAYNGPRSVPGAPPLTPAGSFGRKMTMDDLIAKQVRVGRQDAPRCAAVSFDRDAANAFQLFVAEALAFAVKRGGFLYGTVSESGVAVDFIYEPPQHGTESSLLLLRDPDEERLVDAIAAGLGMRRVGFIFTQAVGQSRDDCTLSNLEVIQAAGLHAESGLAEWVTAVVKLEVNEDGGADVHFEAFQMSDVCVRLFKEEWFETEGLEDLDPKLSKLKKDVVVGVKDTREVDNDFFLVVVKIMDHLGLLSSSFPIENRNDPATMKDLKNHLDRMKHLPFVKRISDFHLLLFLARFLDVSDVSALAECVFAQSPVPEGYVVLIESFANAI